MTAFGEIATRVWVWGTAPVDVEKPEDHFSWGLDIDSYFKHVSAQNSLRFFFNLKFDGNFIIPELLKRGFEFVENDRDGFSKGQFTALISDMNKFYSIKVKWENGHVTEWNDAAKKFSAGMSVAGLAKTYQLPQSKGEIDYDFPRPVGYVPTDEELDYLRTDVCIVARALKITRDNGMRKLTIGSDALAEYKRISGGDKYFRRRFPVLGDAMDAEIRRAYRGGFTYPDSRFQGRRVGSGIVLDVNSLYPHIMYSTIVPYGEPEYVDGLPEITSTRPCVIFSVTFTAKLKPDHIPCIQIKGSALFGSTEYLRSVDEPTTLMVTDIDWGLWNEQYDISVISYNGGWRFKGAMGLFTDYIDKWSEIKVNSVGGQRDIAKLYQNSLYGKLCSNPNVTGKIPYLDDKGIVRYRRGENKTKAPIYTAAGVFITSNARALTIRAAQDNYDVFAYADTDSLHLLTNKLPRGLEIHPSKLGAWKLEYEFEEAYYVRAKAYMERLYAGKHRGCVHPDGSHSGAYHTAWAGLKAHQTAGLTFDDLIDGRVITGKLTPHVVPGGVVLKDVPYKMNLTAV